MSRHWKPDEETKRRAEAGARAKWPEGATAGLLVVATACIGVATVLYVIAGPRDPFAP